MGVAGWALTISLFTLGLNAWMAWVRWPRLAVIIYPTVTHPGHEGGRITESYKLIALNQGAEATTVVNVGLRGGGFDVDFTRESELNGAAGLRGPELPLRIEGHGSAAWVVDESWLERFPYRTEIDGYAHRYKNFRKYPRRRRSTIRETKTTVSMIRNGGDRGPA